MTNFSHGNEFSMVSTLVCMKYLLDHDFTKLLDYMVFQFRDNTELVSKFVAVWIYD